MGNEFKDFFLKILETVGFDGDKEEYLERFFSNLSLEVLSVLLERLPDAERAILYSNFQKSTDSESMLRVLQEKFTQEEIQKTFEKTAQRAVERYVYAMLPILSPEKIKALFSVLKDGKSEIS